MNLIFVLVVCLPPFFWQYGFRDANWERLGIANGNQWHQMNRVLVTTATPRRPVLLHNISALNLYRAVRFSLDDSVL
jgi:hypothetical protein